jgi:hypothetical protein
MTDDDDFVARVGRVVDGMLVRGCPCRYPRFRASCERDSKDLGAPGYTTWDQSILVAQFEQKVPRNVISDGPRLRRGQCAVCGANYAHTIEEYFRDAWIERLEIKPVLSEIGAPLYAALPRCCPFYAAGPHGRDYELHLLDLHYPQLSTDEWVAWLVEEAT